MTLACVNVSGRGATDRLLAAMASALVMRDKLGISEAGRWPMRMGAAMSHDHEHGPDPVRHGLARTSKTLIDECDPRGRPGATRCSQPLGGAR